MRPRSDRRKFLRWAGATAAGQLLLACEDATRGLGVDGGIWSDAGLPGSPDGGAGSVFDAGVSSPAPLPGLIVRDLDNRTPRSLLRGSGDELDLDLYVIDGRLPHDIFGHAFIVCAVPKQDGNFIINGDGMLHRLDFTGGAVQLRTRLTKTPCWYAEQAVAGTDDAFESKGAARMSKALGVRNQANTGLVPMGTDRLLVTFDAGRPFEVDPVSLELKTPVGYHDEWERALDMPDFLSRLVLGTTFPLVQSTAHPCYDHHTEEVYSLNYGGGLIEILGQPVGGAPFTRIVRWDGAGELEHFVLVTEDGESVQIEQSGHQMQVTEQYVVIMDCAFMVETDFMFNPESFHTQKNETVFYVVRRADLDAAASGSEVLATRFTLPREAPHFLADYDNPGGRLVLQLVHNTAYDASEWLRPNDVRYDTGEPVRSELLGMLSTTTDNNLIGRYVIDMNARRVLDSETQLMQHDDFTWGVTLYAHRGMWMPGRHDDLWWVSTGFAPDTLPQRVGDAYADYLHRSVPMSQLPFQNGKPCAIFRTDMRTGTIADGFTFPRGRVVSSPQFIPKEGGGEDADGYLVCTVMSDDTASSNSSGDEFWIFASDDLQKGPICRLGHPWLNLPFTLHTTWMPAIAPRTAGYRVDVRQDHAAQVASLSPQLQTMFDQQVYPHFDD